MSKFRKIDNLALVAILAATAWNLSIQAANASTLFSSTPTVTHGIESDIQFGLGGTKMYAPVSLAEDSVITSVDWRGTFLNRPGTTEEFSIAFFHDGQSETGADRLGLRAQTGRAVNAAVSKVEPEFEIPPIFNFEQFVYDLIASFGGINLTAGNYWMAIFGSGESG